MSIYAQGWLARFLDPNSQPDEIRQFLAEENTFLQKTVPEGTSLIDIGCGFGRHLELLHGRIHFGLGIDINPIDVRKGNERLKKHRNILLWIADAVDSGIKGEFGCVICMNNSFGNFSDKERAAAEMLRLLSPEGILILSVYNEHSIGPRMKWYENTGLKVKKVTASEIMTDRGFSSGHFTKARVMELFPGSSVTPLSSIGYLLTVNRQ